MSLMRPRQWSLMVKIPLTITAVVLGVTLTIGVIVIQQNWTRGQAALESQTLLLARAAAANAAEAILRNDVWSLYRAVKEVGQRRAGPDDPLIVEAAFVDPTGAVLAHIDPAAHPVGLKLAPQDEAGAALLDHALAARVPQVVPEKLRLPGRVDAVVPIMIDDTRIGALLLASSTVPLRVQLQRNALIVLSLALGLAFAGSALGTLVSRRMVSPLHALSQGIDAVSRGDYAAARPVEVVDRDEVGRLAEQFNAMVEELAEKKRLERELAHAERLAGLGRFAAGLAHEVNNPLAGMLNCVSMMKRRPGDAALAGKYLPLLDTGLSRIAATMQALLGELRGETVTRVCNMACVIDLEGMVRSQIGDRPIRLEWNAAPLLDATLDCTCPHVHQIVLNLARNAVEAMREGGRLSVTARRRGSELEIVVEDDGPGIPEEEQKYVLEPFHDSSKGGPGLGLWITYRLAQRMGGRIALRSTPGAGTRFVVMLPLKPGRPAVLPQPDARPPEAPHAA